MTAALYRHKSVKRQRIELAGDDRVGVAAAVAAM